jgi:DNA-binding transcriptional ArsR family regulator
MTHRRMVPEPAVDTREVYSLLDDEYARRILIETYEETRSASALCEACDASEATVYRRLERLQQQELVESVQEIDPNEGPHEVYAARLDHVSIDLTAAGFEVDIEYVDETAADRLTRLYEELSG